MAEEVEELFKYAVKSDGFNMWLGGEHVHAKSGVLTLNKKQHEELQALTKHGKRPDITTELTYLDMKAAEDVAKEYMKNTKAAAHQGAAHSQASAEKVGTDLKEVTPKEPPGMTLKDRLAANAQQVLANAKEESVSHGEDRSLTDMAKI